MIQQTTFRLTAKRRGCHLITHEVLQHLPSPLPKVGLINLFVQHTSCALSINENADPDVCGDMEKMNLICFDPIHHGYIELDSADKLFPALTTERMFQMIGSLPEEAMALHRASAHVQSLQRTLKCAPRRKLPKRSRSAKAPSSPCTTAVTPSMTSGRSAVSAAAAPSSEY